MVTSAHLEPEELTVRDSRTVRTRIELHGLDVVPVSERRGSPRQLGLMWSGVVLNVFSVAYGALLLSLGLSPLQCVLAILVGNLSWIVTGLASLPGPRTGTTTFVVNRVVMGRLGNRPLTVFNWLMQVGYEVLDLVLMVYAVRTLLGLAGVEVSPFAQIGLVVALTGLQSVLPVMGHATITRTLRLLIGPFAVTFLLLAWLTADRLDLAAPVAPAGWAVFLGGVALAASGSGLGWTPNATDFSRYLPQDARPARVVAAVALGGAVPQVLLMVVGVGLGLVSKAASDPVSALSGVYPTWFVVVYLTLLLVQLACLNAMNCYSSGLTLQAAGLPLNRWQAVVLDCVVCAVLASLVVVSGDFYAAVSSFLLFGLVWFAPWSAIYVVAHLMRRNRLGPQPPPRFSTPGLLAQGLGMAAAALCLVTSVWSGWVAEALHGADLSVPAGIVVGGLTYWLLARRSTSAS